MGLNGVAHSRGSTHVKLPTVCFHEPFAHVTVSPAELGAATKPEMHAAEQLPPETVVLLPEQLHTELAGSSVALGVPEHAARKQNYADGCQ